MKESSSTSQSARGKIRRSTQLKKWFVTKICEHSRGRQLIHKLSGNVGVDVIDAAYSLIIKHSGKEVAEEVIVHLYKVVCKVGILIMDKEITDQMMLPCKHPNLVLMHCLAEKLEEPATSRNVSGLLDLMEDCYTHINSLLSMFEGSAPERLLRLKNFVTGTDIVSFFLSSEKAKNEREIILNNMRTALFPYEAEIHQVTEAMKRNLQRRKMELDRLLNQPAIVDYLRNPRTFAVLCNWFAAKKGSEAINWLYFYKAARDYSTLTSRSLLNQRAFQIKNKHLLEAETCRFPISLPSAVHERILELISCDECVHSLFSEAIVYTLSIFEDEFTVILLEGKLFNFLREELAIVESKLNALSRQDLSGCIHLSSDLQFSDEQDKSLSICEELSGQSIDQSMDVIERLSFWN